MSGNSPLVSIVTPSYNQGRFIEDTLLSVKNQDYPSIEHIVVDGSSTDNTLEILRTYEGTYDMRWISEPDRGQSDAVNKGFGMAKGDIVGWLNSDDVYFDGHAVSYVVEQFDRMHDVDVIYGDGVLINEVNLIVKVWHSIPWFDFSRLRRLDFIPQPSTFLRRNVILTHDFNVDLELAIDYDFWLKIARDGATFQHVDRILSAFRSHGAAKTNTRWEELQAESKKVKQQYGQYFDAQYYALLALDYLILVILKIRGVKTIMGLYSNRGRGRDLAFHAEFDSLLGAAFRQAFRLRLYS